MSMDSKISLKILEKQICNKSDLEGCQLDFVCTIGHNQIYFESSNRLKQALMERVGFLSTSEK